MPSPASSSRRWPASDRLDRAGILDLAEVRWRTGDLAGAEAAAAAWLEDGDEPGPDGALAHAISAEAAADRGALTEATRHVGLAAAGLADRRAWEALLAGILPRAAWPWSVEEAAAPDEAPEAETAPAASWTAPTDEAVVVGEATELPEAAGEVAALGAAETSPSPGAPPGGVPISRSAAELIRAGAPLLAGAPDRAAILLALALRADRAAAEAVLAALDAAAPPGGAAPGRPAAPGGTAAPPDAVAALAFVRAEALRAAGRHDELRIAYASAERLALAPAEAGPPGSPQ